MASAGTQSPSSEKPDPLVPGGGKQMTQADQRPAAGSDVGPAPGDESTGGASASALKVAQESASNLEPENRKETETA
ncbi:uncharacterized protein IL334_003557 [Kwoniella shivajii]|uniref:Uncharacterized protein n=1 Tax=Kwoniella shivajii TaxID=564305 RepID=A0ABZ1CYG0_9TREE|nr:hypothetical protein IL334_003557 [Kwoniella shivajii]